MNAKLQGQVWLTEGRIEFRNYSLRYRPNVALALKHVNLTINGQEKVRKPLGSEEPQRVSSALQ